MNRSFDPYSERRETADDAGFTLVEVLIVVMVLGILSAVALLAFGNQSGTTSEANCKAAFRSVQGAVQAYKADMGGFPNATAGANGNGALPATDGDTGGQNAAAATSGAGSELLVKGDSSPNTVASAATAGPWLQTLPLSNGHWSIGVSNNGSGTVSVYSKTGALLGSAASSCPAT
jgi:prepilin-type N-terminal cleavage/methylation domain-containing protein